MWGEHARLSQGIGAATVVVTAVLGGAGPGAAATVGAARVGAGTVGAARVGAAAAVDRPSEHRVSAVAMLAVPDAERPASGCLPASRSPVPDGQPIVVSMPPAKPFTVGRIPASAWRRPPVDDPSWLLAFRGLTWMQSLAQRAWEDRQLRSLKALVDQAITFQVQNPDPGTSEHGWDEGTALRRLETLNCLYALSRTARLLTSMATCVNVQFGPRYYGPPHRAVHNHGLMANIRVARAGQLTGNRTWRTRALARIRSEAPLAWSRAGTSWEQSSTYHKVNIDLWNEAAATLAAADRSDRTPATIRAATGRARKVWQWMTEPDGRIVKIGDSDDQAGEENPRNYARAFRDDAAGWIIGRWSWSDRRTTYYTLRYGPPRRAHGHQDRPGITWSTAGVRVLVGPGRYTYDVRSAWHAYQISQRAHSTSNQSSSLRTRESVRVTGAKVQGTAHAWTTSDALYSRRRTRNVNVNGSTRTVTVTDTFAGSGGLVQTFHLDPAWTLTSRTANRLVLSHPSGRRLRITTTGSVSAVFRGRTSPTIAGWSFPYRNARVAGCEVYLRSTRPSLRTSLVVT